MIDKLIEYWNIKKPEIRERISKTKINSLLEYRHLLLILIEFLGDYDENTDQMNPKKITMIDDGDYQGTLIFIIPEDTYQPYHYWCTSVFYGSCGSCDTLKRIHEVYNYDEETLEPDITSYSSCPTESQVDDYMTICLHLVQRMKIIHGEI